MARAHSGCEVWQQDFLKLELPEKYFDGVFANAALFHVPSQELPRVLLELHTTLKSGGVLFSSNPRGRNDAPLRHHRDRKYQLAIQKPQLKKLPESTRVIRVGAQAPPAAATASAPDPAASAAGPSYALRG